MGDAERKPLLSVQTGDDAYAEAVQSRGKGKAWDELKAVEAAGKPYKWRVTVCLLLSLCNVSLYLSRANISVAALYMFKDCLPWQKWVFAGFYLG